MLARILCLALLALAPLLLAREASRVDLAGLWRLKLDAPDKGLAERWFASPLQGRDLIPLPGTTDLAGYGYALDTNALQYPVTFPATTRFPGVKEPVRADEHGYLVRRHLFVGPAWYEREFEVPNARPDQHWTLHLERVLWQSEAWVDGRPVGLADSLVSEHRHELGVLSPGLHRLTLRVDNRMIRNLSTITHAYGPETQSLWNGVVGSLYAEAREAIALVGLQAYPAADRRSLRLVLALENLGPRPATTRAHVELQRTSGKATIATARVDLPCPAGSSRQDITLQLKEPAPAWDEFNPALHRVRARLLRPGPAQPWRETTFGFRHLERVGKELRLNDRTLFLRGTLDCAVYPRTGHPPMRLADWEKTLGVVKAYGFNHVRFHTWCPPEAAFAAADKLGLYLQAEAPAWVDDWGTATITRPRPIGKDPEVTRFLQDELQRMSEAYGNHPSFLLCAIGNEFGHDGTDWACVNALVQDIKRQDPRRLYAGCGARRNLEADDYWFTHDSGASTRGVGPANTDWDFSKALAGSPVPLIAHETGQRPVFPDYPALLPKFSGPLLPLNLERHQRSLQQSGLEPQLQEFVRASARFQWTQYKAEHEAMLRTRGYAGYQLLMLNDFTGQSEALVGILDPFWEPKGIVQPEAVRSWNAPTVLLARFRKFVWTRPETFSARVEIAHFGAKAIPAGHVHWRLRGTDGSQVAAGGIAHTPIRTGGVTTVGDIQVPLTSIQAPAALRLETDLPGASNQWNLWVFEPGPAQNAPDDVLVCRALDNAAVERLRRGGRVLLLAHGAQSAYAAKSGFASVYWSAGWWGDRFSSLGLLGDPRHPALARFPTDGCSDWQWQSLCAGATTFDLTGAPAGFRPIVQPVPDFHFNTLLGQVFEARVEGGSLLVCGYDLDTSLDQRPAAGQLRRSLFAYVAGSSFKPVTALPLAWLRERLGP